MAINKVGSKGIEDGSVATVDLAPGSVTNAKLTNSSFTFDGTSISLGGSDSVNISASWQSVITADGSTGTTAVAGNGYFIDTTSAAHTLTLPSSATIGDFIAIKDYAGTFNTNNLTIARNGHNIQGAANDSLITTNRASLVLVYVDSTKGWLYWEEHNVANLQGPLFISATGGTISTSGDFKIHTFTGDGCFVVSQLGNSPTVPTGGPSNIEYLVVAGGAGGGATKNTTPNLPLGIQYGGAGGGGAGGYRTNYPSPGFTVTQTTYPITVGAGGAGATTSCAGSGSQGSPSIFSTITSTGGGRGAAIFINTGGSGGSGGGGSGKSDGPPVAGGSGNTPPVSPSQGNNGGNGGGPPTSPGTTNAPAYGAGGGGGAGATGGNGSPTAAGAGGNGSANSISGSPVTYAGGGGGSTHQAGGGTGGTGGGGAGSSSADGTAGTSNTGGGGGASTRLDATSTSGAGGKGIVIIRYKFQ